MTNPRYDPDEDVSRHAAADEEVCSDGAEIWLAVG